MPEQIQIPKFPKDNLVVDAMDHKPSAACTVRDVLGVFWASDGTAPPAVHE